MSDNGDYVRSGGAWVTLMDAGWTTVLSQAPGGVARSQWRVSPITKRIEMRGVGTKAAGYGMFAIPAALAPAQNLRFDDPATISPGPLQRIEVTTGGAVSYTNNAAGIHVNFDNVQFTPAKLP